MSLKLRLARAGAKKRPFYRIVVADSRYPRDGRFIEIVGTWNPILPKGDEKRVVLNVERIQHWMGTGLGGLRVFVAGHTAADATVRLDNPSAAPAWDYIVRNKISVSVQLRADKLGQLDAVLAQWPEAIVILDHCARPELDDGPPYAKARAVFALAKYKNLHIKYTTHNVREAALGQSTNAAFCRALVDTFGAHRMAWGSNFPASSGSLHSQLQEALVATASLTAEEQGWIFSGTARSLYPGLGKA